ncbi:RDD family protein [Polynucleobacter paneuropaeus]|nr:RDD family protein [Polynucleobacter paneuropaeus]
MKCNKCGVEVPSSYLKCPSCGFGFHGSNSVSSFDLSKQAPAQQSKKNTSPIFNQNISSSGRALAAISVRFAALLIDGLLILIPAGLMGAAIGIWGAFFDDSESTTTVKAQMVGYLVWILYEAVFLSSAWMATPGKKLLGIKVVDLKGNQISFWRAVGRSAGQFLSSIFFIGYIMAFFTKDKQALHDMMAGTLVIKD